MKSVLLVSISILISCGTSSKLDGNSKVKLAHIGDTNQKTDSYTIENARIEKNQLILTVNFSGGCEGFEGDLIGSNYLIKSFPAKRPIKFILQKEGECREFKSEQFVFDIKELAYKQEKDSEIILLLDGYEQPLSYVFH